MEMFKTLTSVLLAGDNTIEFTDSNITDTSILDCYLTDSELIIEESSQTGTTVSITVSNHSEPVGVALFINNCDTFKPYDDTDVQNELLQLGTRVSLLESSMNNKQDKLTAGENITIENNVISASGGGEGGFVYDNNKTSSVVLSFEDAQPHTYTPLVDEDLFINMYAGNTQNRMVCKIGNLTIIDIGGVSGIHPICIGVIRVKANTPIYLNGNYCFISKVV